MKKLYFLLFFLTFLFPIDQGFAQTSDTLTETAITDAATEGNLDSTLNNAVQLQEGNSDAAGFPLEFWHSLIILIFGIIIIGIEVYLIVKGQIKAKDVMKYIVVTLIITCVMFLITAGHNNDQIAPAMGLLGTIAGYLLGKGGNEKKTTESIEKPG